MAELPAGHIGIEVLAFGLSECDTYQRPGVKKLSDTLGLECSGKVCALGQGVEGFSMGDRVVCLGIGTAGTFYHNEASAFQKIDDNMSYELAAALSVVYTTEY
jgi:NADPH:quinone reductase-like Zn-dependent oxidoreductase